MLERFDIAPTTSFPNLWSEEAGYSIQAKGLIFRKGYCVCLSDYETHVNQEILRIQAQL